MVEVIVLVAGSLGVTTFALWLMLKKARHEAKKGLPK